MAHIELQLPELTTDDFQRAWTRFELVATAKEWNEAKRLTIVPTLLRGKLIDFYTEFDEATKGDLSSLKLALQEKAGLKIDPLIASRNFNQRDQLPGEKIDDYASELKRLFKQAYPDEGLNSTVLLQKFLTGLLAPIARQMLLKKKPDSFSEAIKDAVTIEYALHFDRSSAETQAAVFPPEPINMLTGGGKQGGQKEEYTKLQKTVEALAKQLECLETNLQKSLTPSPSRNYQTPRQNRGPRRRQPVGPCYRCGQEGHYYRQCPLNYHWPASKVDDRWPQNQ